ncbi:MAG: hypothetical protein LBJ39_00895 [Tannerellaceae bacterium]|jgi:hypothetical protein|nr:hypothetical protein [Tannerellaceae bacterium]
MKKVILSMTLPLLLLGCSKYEEINQGIKLSKTNYELNFEQTSQIEAISASEIVYTPESEYVAEVSPTGLITGGRVGKTKINLNNEFETKSIDVTIVPKYNIFPEPIEKVGIGATKNDMIKAFGTPSFESNGGIAMYDDYFSPYIYMFILDSENRIEAMAIAIETLRIPSNLVDFLNERYMPIRMSNDYAAIFRDKNETMNVVVMPSDDNLNLFIMYTPYLVTRSLQRKDVMRNVEKSLKLMNYSN